MRCYCVLHHGQDLALVEKTTPEPQGTEVLLKVKAAGVCHTDLHLWEGHYDMGGGKKLTLAERGIKPPLTLSHEIVGEVVALGPQAQAIAAVNLGQVTLVHPWIGCGECPACQPVKKTSASNRRPSGSSNLGASPNTCSFPTPAICWTSVRSNPRKPHRWPVRA